MLWMKLRYWSAIKQIPMDFHRHDPPLPLKPITPVVHAIYLPDLGRFLSARLQSTWHLHIPLGLGDHRLWGIAVAKARGAIGSCLPL